MTERLRRILVRDGEEWVAELSSGAGYAKTGGVDGNTCVVRFWRDSDPETVFVWRPYMIGDLEAVSGEELQDWLGRAQRAADSE